MRAGMPKRRRTGGGMLPKLARQQVKIIENFVADLSVTG